MKNYFDTGFRVISVRLRTESVDPAGCSKRPSSEAATSEEARRTLRYVEPLSDVRTKLEEFFNIRAS
jgi:hypothetical protein